MRCNIEGCTERSTNEGCQVAFFSFPKDPALKQEWVRLTGRPLGSFSTMFGKICSKHFQESDLVFGKRRLEKVKNCLPTLHLPAHVTGSVAFAAANEAALSNKVVVIADTETSAAANFIRSFGNDEVIEEHYDHPQAQQQQHCEEEQIIYSSDVIDEAGEIEVVDTVHQNDANIISIVGIVDKFPVVVNAVNETQIETSTTSSIPVTASSKPIYENQSAPLIPPTLKLPTAPPLIPPMIKQPPKLAARPNKPRKCPVRNVEPAKSAQKIKSKQSLCRLCLVEVTDNSISIFETFRTCQSLTKITVLEVIELLLGVKVNVRK